MNSKNLFLNLLNVEDIINAVKIILKDKSKSGSYLLKNTKNYSISEIVNETNGALLSGDYIVNDLVMILSQMINGELVFNEKIIINNWSLNFSDRNYSQFCAMIKSL